jgi:hypothetical protein
MKARWICTAVIVCLGPCPAGAAPADEGWAFCIPNVQKTLSDSPAFRIRCRETQDCEFEPSQAMNASAMALIDAMAKRTVACWEKGGMSLDKLLPSPPSMHLSIRRYRSDFAVVCTIAEVKPFDEAKITTAFLAVCEVR